jgi:hypothetical protein
MSAARKSKCALALETQRVVSGLELTIESEHFDLLPTNQDLRRVDFDDSSILKLHKDYFTNYVDVFV